MVIGNKSEFDHCRMTYLNFYVLSKNNKKKENEKMGPLIFKNNISMVSLYIYIYEYYLSI